MADPTQGSSKSKARFSAWDLVEGVDWDNRELIPVVDYQRISHDKMRDAHGVRDQARDNANTAERLGWTIVARFTDNDITASKSSVERPAFDLLVKCLRKGQLPNGKPIRGVIVQDEDRLIKRNDEFERFLEALTYEDGRVFADVRGPKDYYSEDVEGLGRIGVVFRVMETRKKQRRLRDNHRNRAARGVSVGTRVFGWSIEDKDRIDPSVAKIARKAIDELISGRSKNSIVQEWNRNGVLNVRGNPWTNRAFGIWIRNPRLCGLRKLHDELVRDENGNLVVGSWEPLIGIEKWEALQSTMREKDSGLAIPLARKYLLTGYLRCGRVHDEVMCNFGMKGGPYSGRKATHRYYCPPGVDGGCGGVSRTGDNVDRFISEAVLARVERLGVSSTKEEWNGGGELARKIIQRQEITKAWMSGEISGELYWPQVKQLERQIKELRSEQAHHSAMEERKVRDIAEVRDRWYRPEVEGGYDLGQRRAIIGQYIHAVTVHPARYFGRGFDPSTMEIHWR